MGLPENGMWRTFDGNNLSGQRGTSTIDVDILPNAHYTQPMIRHASELPASVPCADVESAENRALGWMP